MKKLLITFGDIVRCSPGKITDRVKTFEDACRILKIDPAATFELSTSAPELEGDLKSIAAYTKLTIIVRALNEGWKPNWEDSSEAKYFPYLKYKSGLGFSTAIAIAGTRLRLSARAFASKAGSLLSTARRNSNHSTTIISHYKNTTN